MMKKKAPKYVEPKTIDSYDLGDYDIADDPDGNFTSNINPPLTWRNGEHSFSDWHIIVSAKDSSGGYNTSTTYHVHKNMLGIGPHRSDYFARLFQSQQSQSAMSGSGLSELGNSTSEIELEYSSARAFPAMLDFIYSSEGDVLAVTETATALRHLANYFNIRELYRSATGFIQRDMNFNTAPVYFSEAYIYHDEKLYNTAKDVCMRNFQCIPMSDLFVLSTEQFRDIVCSPDLICNEEALSRSVASFIRKKQTLGKIDDDVITDLTSRMVRVDATEALFYLKLSIQYRIADGSSLQQRCFESCCSTWKNIPTRTKLDGNSSPIGQDSYYCALPLETRAKLLETALDAASVDIEQTVKEKDNVISSLKVTITHSKEVIDSKNAQIEVYQKKLSVKKNEISLLNSRKIDKDAMLAKKDCEIDRLHKSHASMGLKLKAKSNLVNTFEERISIKENEINLLKKKIAKLKNKAPDGKK